MDITALKIPLVLAVLVGSVIVTNLVTYNIIQPEPVQVDCSAEVSAALDELTAQMQADQEALKRALKPAEGLNPDRKGGLNMSDSIR